MPDNGNGRTAISKGTQLFNVPNNEEGLYFLHLCRKYRQNGNVIRLRGRGQRRILNDQNMIEHYDESLPVNLSDWWAIYMTNPKQGQLRREANRQQYERTKAYYYQEGLTAGKATAVDRIATFLSAVVNE